MPKPTRYFVAKLHHAQVLGLIACDRCGRGHDATSSWVVGAPGPKPKAALVCHDCAGSTQLHDWIDELVARRSSRHRPPVRGAA